MPNTNLSTEPVNLRAVFGGIVNKEPVVGRGTAQYLPNQNIISAHMEFDHYIRTFNLMMASSSSSWSFICSLFSKPLMGAANLASLFGDYVEGCNDFRMQV